MFERTILLTGMDVDNQGVCRASGLLNHLQVTAGLAAEAAGFGRSVVLRDYGAFWMLVRSWFHLRRPLRWDETITIRTWHRQPKAAMMYRDYEILVQGEPVGESVAVWVLANVDSRKLLRLGGIGLLSQGAVSEPNPRTLSKLNLPEPLVEIERRPMRYSDTDINGHVNNIRYADFACDALGMERLSQDRFLSGLQLGYLAECRPGEVLSIHAGGNEQGRYVRGLDENGEPRFEAALFFGEVVH